MRPLTATLVLALAACGGDSEEDAAKDRAAAQAGWVLVLKVDGSEVKLPLKAMNVLLFKDDDVAAKTPTAFEIEGDGVHLLGEIPPAGNPGYSEKWEKLKGLALPIKASGEFHRETVDSKITLGGSEVRVSGGTLTVTGFSGKWAGSQGDKTLKGTITLTLQDGRTLQGTFGVNGVTWG